MTNERHERKKAYWRLYNKTKRKKVPLEKRREYERNRVLHGNDPEWIKRRSSRYKVKPAQNAKVDVYRAILDVHSVMEKYGI